MPPPPPPPLQTPIPSLADIDTSMLDPSQASILASLQLSQPSDDASTSEPSAFTFTTPDALHAHLAKLSQSLEPNIDVFADGLHKIEQYRNTADRVADRILASAAKRLEEKDREGKAKVGSEGIGVGDVLRGLAGVLNES
jgi:kinetochore protein Mis13/DSN1